MILAKRNFLFILIVFTSIFSLKTYAWHSERVMRLAHRVETLATHVHHQAEREAHHGNWAEQRALGLLHQLDNSARHFHRQVERYYQDPHHTYHDFVNLYSTFERAHYAMDSAHFTWHVTRDFDALSYVIDELAHEYNYGGDHRGDDDHGDHDEIELLDKDSDPLI